MQYVSLYGWFIDTISAHEVLLNFHFHIIHSSFLPPIFHLQVISCTLPYFPLLWAIRHPWQTFPFLCVFPVHATAGHCSHHSCFCVWTSSKKSLMMLCDVVSYVAMFFISVDFNNFQWLRRFAFCLPLCIDGSLSLNRARTHTFCSGSFPSVWWRVWTFFPLPETATAILDMWTYII